MSINVDLNDTRLSRWCALSVVFIFLGFLFCQFVSKEDSKMGSQDETTFQDKRLRMVQQQIAARGVQDTLVLNAMRSVRRHRFVPSHLNHAAYDDEPLPIGYEQTISQPYIVALMTEALELEGGERVLEIGTGSGYQAAVLAAIVDTVYTIEIVEPLGQQAKQRLKKEGYGNVNCRVGDGYRGWPQRAPFDAVIVTAAPPSIPEPLFQQLKEGGRMVIPVGTVFQELLLLKKVDGKMRRKRLIPVRFVPMVGEIEEHKK